MSNDQETPDRKAVVLSQRQRSRLRNQDKLLSAARKMLQDGEKLSIAGAAKLAGLSVATAYRHYSDPEKLRFDAALEQTLGPDEAAHVSMFRSAIDGIEDPVRRLQIAQSQMLKIVMGAEADYRLFVATGHEQTARSGFKRSRIPGRGRRIILIEIALEPVRSQLGQTEYCDLVHRLMLLTAAEPFFVLRDILDMDSDQIELTSLAALSDLYSGFMAARAQS